MTVPTIAECRKIDAQKVRCSRSAGAANNADLHQGVIERVDFNLISAAGSQSHTANEFVTNLAPNATDFANAKIGDKYRVFKVDSAKTPTLHDYEEYVKKENGFELCCTQLVTTVTLTSTQVLALYGTPITVISAPGAGKAILIDKVLGWLDFGSTAYDGVATNEDLTLKYTNASGGIAAQLETTGWLDATADAWQYAAANSTVKPIANAVIVASMTTADIATGNSPVKLKIWYRIVDLTW